MNEFRGAQAPAAERGFEDFQRDAAAELDVSVAAGEGTGALAVAFEDGEARGEVGFCEAAGGGVGEAPGGVGVGVGVGLEFGVALGDAGAGLGVACCGTTGTAV